MILGQLRMGERQMTSAPLVVGRGAWLRKELQSEVKSKTWNNLHFKHGMVYGSQNQIMLYNQNNQQLLHIYLDPSNSYEFLCIIILDEDAFECRPSMFDQSAVGGN